MGIWVEERKGWGCLLEQTEVKKWPNVSSSSAGIAHLANGRARPPSRPAECGADTLGVVLVTRPFPTLASPHHCTLRWGHGGYREE